MSFSYALASVLDLIFPRDIPFPGNWSESTNRFAGYIITSHLQEKDFFQAKLKGNDLWLIYQHMCAEKINHKWPGIYGTGIVT